MGPQTVTEGGSTDLITVVLDAQPTSDVVLSVVSNDTGEVSLRKSYVYFFMNWDTPQTITVTGVDDDLSDGTQTSTVTFQWLMQVLTTILTVWLIRQYL